MSTMTDAKKYPTNFTPTSSFVYLCDITGVKMPIFTKSTNGRHNVCAFAMFNGRAFHFGSFDKENQNLDITRKYCKLGPDHSTSFDTEREAGDLAAFIEYLMTAYDQRTFFVKVEAHFYGKTMCHVFQQIRDRLLKIPAIPTAASEDESIMQLNIGETNHECCS